jgi:alcohol dehydrogenase class IV
MTQKEYIGFNSVKFLKSILAECSARKIFLVTGKTSYLKSGAKNCLSAFFADYEVEQFCDFDSNPKAKGLKLGIEVFNQAGCDVVIAVGGGSVIDMAKMINFCASNKLGPKKCLTEIQFEVVKGRPLIAVPTTAGSGSEATHFAVLYIDHKKFSFAHEYILADVAIVDPQFMRSLPKRVAASSGMDALSQAVESYWCIHSDDESKRYAREAIELAVSNLATAVNNPTEPARLAMAKAAHLAGKAINISKTTASHAISYPLTSYFGIPHGQAVGLTLSNMLEYNAKVDDEDVCDPRGCEYVQRTINEIAGFLGQSSITAAKNTIDDLIHEIGLETALGQLIFESQEDIETIIVNGFDPDRMINNPRKVTKQTLRKILEMVY